MRGIGGGALLEDFALVEVVGDVADVAFRWVTVGYFFDAGVRHGCCVLWRGLSSRRGEVMVGFGGGRV